MLEKVKSHRQDRKLKKAQRKAERWAPYREKQQQIYDATSGFASKISADYRTYTIAVVVLTVLGYFYMPFIEVCAILGCIAMRKHWNTARENNDPTPGLEFWRALPVVSFIPAVVALILSVVGLFVGKILPFGVL